MKVKLNGVDIECTPEEFRQLNLGKEIRHFEMRSPRIVRNKRRQRKNSIEYLQRTLSPVFGTNRGKIGHWGKEDDQHILSHYPFGEKTRKHLSLEDLDTIEKMCHRLHRTPRALRQRAWFLQRLQSKE